MREPPRSARLTGIVIGAGSRGTDAYAPYLLDHPEEGSIRAVAEPLDARREALASRHGIPSHGQFRDYRDVLAAPRLADFAIVATDDQTHLEPAVMAMEQGYDVLLEKPMALTEDACRELVATSERTGRVLQVCHVLRYAPFFETIHDLVAGGELGDILTIQLSENVSYWHYAHSYCRGIWRNSSASSPMILAKSCHDLDILYWLAGSTPSRIASVARETELCEKNRPEGAPAYCIEGCPHAASCPYDAVAMYLEARPLLLDLELSERHPLVRWLARQLRLRPWLPVALSLGWARRFWPWRLWPVSAVTTDTSREGIEEALRSTTYGRCVYQVGDNDQVASQSVSLLFENGVNASFTMHGCSNREGREIRIDGTRGSIQGWFYHADQVLRVVDHKSGHARRISFPMSSDFHGGGDRRLFADFLRAVRGESRPVTTAAEALQSHLMAFAAEESRHSGQVVDFLRYGRGPTEKAAHREKRLAEVP